MQLSIQIGLGRRPRNYISNSDLYSSPTQSTDIFSPNKSSHDRDWRCRHESPPPSRHVRLKRGPISPSVNSAGIIYQWSALCALVSVLVYLNSLDGDLVHDDLSAIRDNPDVTDSNGIGEIFRNDFWGMAMKNPESHKSYRPLTILSFKANFVLQGLSPTGYHVVNVGLHALTTGLFVATAVQRLHASVLSAVVAGLLFATHSIHTEAVSGIVGRADILATLFYLLSFRAYTRSSTGVDSNGMPQTNSQWRSVLFAGVSMLCKEHGLTVIAVSSLWDLLTDGNSAVSHLISRHGTKAKTGNSCKTSSKSLSRTVALVSMGVPLLIFRFWIMGSAMPVFSDQENPAAASASFLTRFLTWSYLPTLNLLLLLCPLWLCYDWQLGTVPLLESIFDPRVLYALVVYYILARISIRIFQSGKPAEIWCLLTLIVPFLPAANILSPVGFVVAERLLYLPSLGFCLLVGQGFGRLWNNCHRRTSRLLLTFNLLLIIASFSSRTWMRNRDWLSRESLFTSGLRTFPSNGKMHYNYANLQKDLGGIEKAIFHYREAIRLWPTHASAHNNLGTLLADPVAAKFHFEEALKIHPRHANGLYNLAAIHRNDGNMTTAARLLESCLKVEPFHREALKMMGGILADKGDIKRVYIVNLFIIEAHRRRGKRKSETSELWNNLSRTIDSPLRHADEPPNILQYLPPYNIDKLRFMDHPISGFYQQPQ